MPRPQDDPAGWVEGHAVEVVERRTRDSKTFWRPRPGAVNPEYVTVFGRHFHWDDGGELDTVRLAFEPDGLGGWHIPRSGYPVAAGALGIETFARGNGRGIRWLLDLAPTVDPGTSHVYLSAADLQGTPLRFLTNGLHWYATPTGLKMQTTIDAAIGPRQFGFQFSKLGGADDPVITPEGHADFGDFVVKRPYAECADTVRREGGGWSLGPGQRLTFSWDDSGFPAEAFPYVLDPTTDFDIAVGSEDGYAESNWGAYPPVFGAWSMTNTVIATYKQYSAPNYRIMVGLMRWDTSTLSDDVTITAAELDVYAIDSNVNPDNRTVALEWYDFGGGTPDSNDYSSTVVDDAYEIGQATFGPSWDLTSKTFTLRNVTSINKTGYTGIRSHISGGAPTGSNQFRIASYENASYAEPRLSVTYSAPVVDDPLRSRHYIGSGF